MIRLDYLFFGYFEIKISRADAPKAADIFLKDGISLRLRDGCGIILPARERERVIALLDGKIEYTVSETKGVYGFVRKNRRRYGVMGALFLSAILYFFLAGLVWDVRIEGCETGREAEIVAELSECGLSVGSFWRSIDKNAIETKTLQLSDNVSWLNINRRGAVAYVAVVDKVVHDEEAPYEGYANVIAARDCIIEEITVKRGIAAVKPGMSVKKGDLLISGVLPMELGGGFCYAEGEVIGRFSDGVTVQISSVIEEREYSEQKLFECSAKIFGFNINIFKRYGNLGKSCDIIEETKKTELWGGKMLPVSLTVKYLRNYTESRRTYTSEEMVALASERLRESILSYSIDKDILRMTTYGNFNENGYVMYTDMVCRGSVTEIGKFEVQTENK